MELFLFEMYMPVHFVWNIETFTGLYLHSILCAKCPLL
jgi:hypothetical protein